MCVVYVVHLASGAVLDSVCLSGCEWRKKAQLLAASLCCVSLHLELSVHSGPCSSVGC